MDPELKELLEENLRIAEENNEMLRSMRKTARWSLIGKIILYALVILIPLFFIQSYLGPYMDLLNGTSSKTGTGTNPYGATLQNIVNQYQIK
jgi:hypothetical protein